MSDDDKIKAFLEKQGVTQCPPGSARGADEFAKKSLAGTAHMPGATRGKWNPVRDYGQHEKLLDRVNLAQKHYRRNQLQEKQ